MDFEPSPPSNYRKENRRRLDKAQYAAVTEAWRLLLQVADEAYTTSTPPDAFLHDLVDVTRQAMANVFEDLYNQVIAAYEERSFESAQSIGLKLLGLISDFDQILATNNNFLLGTWTENARNWTSQSNDSRSTTPFFLNALDQRIEDDLRSLWETIFDRALFTLDKDV